MQTIKPEAARKCAAFVKAINQVCATFDMDMSLPEEGAPLYMNVSEGEPDDLPFVMVHDPEGVPGSYELGWAGTFAGD